MGAAEISSRTAWIVAVLLGFQASLGLFRARALPAANSAPNALRRSAMASHPAIGFALPVLTFLHAWSSMKLPAIRRTSAVGLWMATLALLLLFVQALTGVSMLGSAERITIRRWHLATAITLLVLSGAHVALNG